MNISASSARAIVAIDQFIHHAISEAWEMVCQKAIQFERLQPSPEDEYGGGDICSLEETPSTEDDQPLE